MELCLFSLAQSYNGTLDPSMEPKVILEHWNSVIDSSYIGTLDFISTPKVILELWNYIIELGVILEL